MQAQSIARRIAEEQGWTLGREVGWQMRHDTRASADTRLLVATEGILTARLQQDPLLSDFRTVVLDEFHERSLHADVGLALMAQALRARADLRLVVMSATLDPAPLGAWLGTDALFAIDGRRYPVRIEHDITERARRLVVLGRDVHLVPREHVVEAAELAGQVPLHLDEARPCGPGRELHLREIHRAGG